MPSITEIDETGFYFNMKKTNGRCVKGSRCYNTTSTYPFVKFNFICAIENGKIIGYKFKKRNSINADKFIACMMNVYKSNKYKKTFNNIK